MPLSNKSIFKSRIRLLISQKYREKGFTLIETVLAFSLLVVLLGLVLTSLRMGIRSYEKGEAEIGMAGVKRSIAARFQADVSSIFLYTLEHKGEKRYVLDTGPKSFGFVSSSLPGAMTVPWGGVRFINYTVNEQGLTVSEKILPSSNPRSDGSSISFVLESGVRKIQFLYHGNNGWMDRWDVDSEKKLPDAVRAKIFFKDVAKPYVITVPLGVRL